MIRKIFLLTFLFALVFLLSPKSVFAEACTEPNARQCPSGSIGYTSSDHYQICNATTMQWTDVACTTPNTFCYSGGYHAGADCRATVITPTPAPVVTPGPTGPLVGATDIPTGCGSGPGEVATLDCIFPLLRSVVDWALILSGSIALIFLLIGAIMFLTSGGDQKRVDSAKKTMTFAILGIVLIFLSFAIINLIAYVTQVNCIKILGFQACAT